MVNSTYGYSIRQPDRNLDTKIMSERAFERKAAHNPNLCEVVKVSGKAYEDEEEQYKCKVPPLVEVSSKKDNISHNQPVQLGFQCLQVAKCVVIEFYFWLLDWIGQDNCELLMTVNFTTFQFNKKQDTDSLYIALSAPSILECVAADRREDFLIEARDRMVLNEEAAANSDQPLEIGKFKIEAEGAELICPSPKSYLLCDEAGNILKMSSKGIQNSLHNKGQHLTRAAYLKAIRDLTSAPQKTVITSGLRMDKKSGALVFGAGAVRTFLQPRTEQSGLYVKRRVLPCLDRTAPWDNPPYVKGSE